MNAVRKKDGFFMRLHDKVYDQDGNDYTWDEVELVINGRLQSELVSDIDYEALRNHAAIAAMQGMLFNLTSYGKVSKELDIPIEEVVASGAVAYADALIERLKKE